MKLMVISDLHGYYEPTLEAYQIFERSGADYLVILGDLDAHGPANPIKEGYDPLKTAGFLKLHRERIILIKGNCEAQVDEVLVGQTILDHNVFILNGHKVFCTHGHIFSESNLPNGLTKGDILLRGHYHVPKCELVQEILVASPGSIGVPKGGSKPSYIILDEKHIECRTLDGSEVFKRDL